MRERRAGGGCGIERLGMRASAHGEEEARGKIKEKGKERERKKRKRRKRERGGKRRKAGVEGPIRKTQKTEEGGCKMQGGRRKRARAGIRVCSRVCLAGLLGLASWATLSQPQNILFFFCKTMWQLIFENGDDCLDKIFFRQF